MDVPEFLQWSILWFVFLSLGVLFVTSLIMWDTRFIREKPWTFLLETVMFAVLPAIIYVGIFYKTRHVKKGTEMLWLGGLIMKFMLLHIFLQLSGVYSLTF